jgi:hypothetical protein
MKKLFLFVAICLLISSAAFAQDPGARDSVIVDSVAAANGQGTVNVNVYFTSDDSVGAYNVPLGWFPRESNVHASTNTQYYYPMLNNWQFRFDTLVINDGYTREIGIYDIGGDSTYIPVISGNSRVHVWRLTYIIPPGVQDIYIRLDTVYDNNNGSMYFGLADGIHGFMPVFKKGGICIGNCVTGIDDPAPTPTDFALNQNYPNPFNPQTNIEFALPKEQNVVLSIYNVLGQNIRTLINGSQDAGLHNVRWDGKSDAGADVPSGIYFYKIYTPEFSQTNKMLLLR